MVVRGHLIDRTLGLIQHGLHCDQIGSFCSGSGLYDYRITICGCGYLFLEFVRHQFEVFNELYAYFIILIAYP